MNHLAPTVREKAIEIANASLGEGHPEGQAVRIAIARAKEWAKRRASIHALNRQIACETMPHGGAAVDLDQHNVRRNAYCLLGAEPSVVLDKVLEGKGSFGYNAATDEYGDLIAMGVLDPVKVTRTALQNAASIASLILTTDAMVPEVPEKEARPSAMGEMAM